MIPCSMKKGNLANSTTMSLLQRYNTLSLMLKMWENVQFRINKMIGIFGFPLCKENI